MAKIHPLADVQTMQIGENTFVWQYCVILKDAVIGDHCNINCQVFIENDVKIGDNVTIKPGVQIWDGVTLEDNVFIGPNVTFTNDLVPRSKHYPEAFAKTLVKKGATIGANATIVCGVTIGEHAFIGAGAVVNRDVEPYALMVGVPASQIGWVNEGGDKIAGL